MLTKIEATNSQGVVLALPLFEADSGFVVKEVEGLDPVDASINSSNIANLDGEQYQSSRREKRNIVIHLDLKPKFTTTSVSNLRRQLYGYFMPKANVKLRLYDEDFGNGYVDILGMVESCAAPLFTKEPEATISILCFKPDFIAPDPVVVEGYTTEATVGMPLDYRGTVDTGFIFRMAVDRYVPNFLIAQRPEYNLAEDDLEAVLEFEQPLYPGDILTINTNPGAKGAYLTRSGATNSILYGVTQDSDWVVLSPGPNALQVFTAGTPLPYTITYTNKYGGL